MTKYLKRFKITLILSTIVLFLQGTPQVLRQVTLLFRSIRSVNNILVWLM